MSARSKFHSLLQAANFSDAIRKDIVAEILGEHAHELAEEIRQSDVGDCCEECRAAVELSARVIDPEVSDG